MDRIDCMRAFVATVELGGLSAAARHLRAPRARISKQIQALERMLGVQLLMRTTRSSHPTTLGAEYFLSAQEILRALEDAEQRLHIAASDPRGVLRINAPMSFAVRVLAPLLPAFHRRYPDLDLQLLLADELLDPVQEGLDVTIRVAELVDSSMSARRIMPAPRALVASPGLILAHGPILEPKDLEARPFLNYSNLQGGATLPLRRGAVQQRLRLSGPLCANNGDVLATAAEADMGVALLPRFIVQPALDAGRLLEVLPDWEAPPIAVNALFAGKRALPQRTRVFIDYLVQALDPGQAGKRRPPGGAG
jgi:DNA-binding transcriptional LysR family regulator